MGLRKNIETPEILWDLFIQYRDELINNPLYRNEFNAKAGRIVSIPLKRPLTWAGFEAFCYDKGIIQDLEDYRYNTGGRYKGFKGIITRINSVMYAEKFEGAAAGIYQQNIIARELGLTDKKDLSSSDGTLTPKPTVVVQDQKTADEVNKLIGSK